MDSIPGAWQWAEVVSTVAAGGVLTFAGATYTIYRWCLGPRFRVGVPPSAVERDANTFRWSA